MKKKDKVKQLAIKIPKKELIQEHKQLLSVLKSGKGIKAEARKQAKELKAYEK